MDAQKRLLGYIKPYWKRLILAGVCAVVMTGCTLGMSTLIQWFADAGISKPITDNPIINFMLVHHWIHQSQVKSTLMWVVAVLIVVISIPNAIFSYANAYLVASVTNLLGADVRFDIYKHIQTLPLRFFHKSRAGDIMSRMSNDVSLIQNSSQIVVQVIDGPIKIIGGLGSMFVLSWKLSLFVLIFVPPMVIVIDKITKKLKSLTKTTQGRLADVNSVVEESIRGVRIVKSFGMEDQEVKRFDRVNQGSLSAILRYWRRNALVAPIIELMGAIVVAVIILIGGWMVVNSEITFPALTRFAFLAFIVAGSAKQLGRLNALRQQTLGAADRVFEILDTKSDLIEDPNGAILHDVQGRVEFAGVSFEYNPGERVLDNVSFRIDSGEVVAIVGPSGAGKSTIADLIPRFYDVTGGSIMVEGIDIRNINTKSLREQIAMVPQETILFSGTISENISYGRPGADMADIIEVAKAANAHEFILQQPNGYETELGEGGVGLSGGQRQRISIARALLKNPKILILDEATSSLDAASEGVVQEALDRLMRGRSTLVIAHRLSTVKSANRILVIDHGRVIESGAFDHLLEAGGMFEQLYRTQFRTQEVR
ncbi:MAG: ABC transporter ATP-binding protein [Armatimonadota bacterium]|nr:ABC transporter ATP-binding protein/permease [bacterium]